MKKKILSVLLAGVIVVSVLAGCGKKDSKPQEGNKNENEEPGKVEFDFTKNLSNKNASDKANAVYNWLISIKGKYIISGLEERCADTGNVEFNFIRKETGKLPGLRGLDFINGDYEGVVRRAITWDKQHSLISICWHMGVPGSVDAGYDSSKSTCPDLKEALNNPESETYKQIIADMDKAAEPLKQLQDAGVVVLWRPFHEFDGKWFWWGKGGSESFVKLWQIMYDRYTNVHGLNNLIWVLGYSGAQTCGSESWYPGDEYVDIIGADSYSNNSAENGYSSLYSLLNKNLAKSGKPYTLHECGRIPDINALQSEKVEWLWFLVWHTGYINDEKNNSIVKLHAAFESDYVLTLDEMPDFSSIK
ncbi:MAG: glycosyl hydrolase [Clostridiales bacterium]|nr:glycosyl hydrolase [Clostridiales bacterium]